MGAKRTRRDNKSFNVQALFVFLTLIAIITVVILGINNGNKRLSNQNQISKNNNSSNAQEVIPEDKTATIVAIGDTLCHSQVFKDAYDIETGIYDFSPLFKDVAKYF